MWLQAKAKKWLKVGPLDYEKYDMDQSILKSEIEVQKWCNRIWSIQKHPLFILKSGLFLNSTSDLPLLLKGSISLVGHLRDYARNK